MTTGEPDTGPGLATSAMVARPRELLRELREGKDTVKALKAIKNQVIGNKFKKNAFVSEGAVEQLLDILKGTMLSNYQADQVDVVQQQAAVVIGSLSLSEAGLQRLMTHEGLPLLISMLHSGDEAVVEASLRAVKMAVQQSACVPSYLIHTPAGADTSDPSCLSAAPTTTTIAPATAAATAAPSVRLDASAMFAVVRCLTPPGSVSLGASSAGSMADSGATTTITITTTIGDGGGGGGGGGGHVASAVASVRPGRAAAISALAAAVVACCCRRDEERDVAIGAGAPEGLLRLLLQADRPDTQVAALEGLSLMLPHQPSACALALARPDVYGRLFLLLRDPSPSVRLLAASCAATLSRLPGCTQSEPMQRAALPVLLRLLAQPATRPHVPAVLARLIEGSEPLQKAAADADTVRLLAGVLAAEAAAAASTTTPAPPPPPRTSLLPPLPPLGAVSSSLPPSSGAGPSSSSSAPPSSGLSSVPVGCSASSRLREGCLRALGSLCLNRDDSRKQLLEAKVLRHIVRSLEDPHDGVRGAAALCVRALSRCVRTLRGGLLDGGGGELAPALVRLLTDTNQDVQASAAAAVCNLVLDFSAAKSAVLAAGGLSALVALTASRQPALRHHATWALGNLLYRADHAVRVALMQALPWSRMRELVSDADPRVVEQALVILRNLCMGDRHHIAATLQWADCGGGGGGLQQAATAAATTAATTARVSHHIHIHSQGRDQGQPQQQQPGGEGGKEGLLDVLLARVAVSASASSPRGMSEDEDERGPSTLLPPRDPLAAAATTASLPDGSVAAAASPESAAVPPPPQPSNSVTAASHALYAIANLLTGAPAVKDLVATRRPLLQAVATYLQPTAAGELALPAVWCAVNLTWLAGSSSSSNSVMAGGGAEREGRSEQDGVAARCRALVEVGGLELLEELSRSHPWRDVQERAKTALEQLRSGAPAAGGVAPMLVM